jgi:hypothetical protein
MTVRIVLPALASMAVLASASVWGASADERWTAYSTTAISVTGDVIFSPGRITFGNGRYLPLAAAGSIARYNALGKSVTASLFRVTAPADPVLLHGNRLCGGRTPEPVTFIVVSTPEHGQGEPELRSLDVFATATPPNANGSAQSCGTYNYEPAAPTPLPASRLGRPPP